MLPLDRPMERKLDILQGTLDLMVLRTLATLGRQHGYAIAGRLEQIGPDLSIGAFPVDDTDPPFVFIALLLQDEIAFHPGVFPH